MTGLAVVGGCALVLLIPLLSALLSIYNAYWAAKVWAILVVPVFHWAPLPLAGAVGVALVIGALRPQRSEPTEEDKSATERILGALGRSLLTGPLIFAVAWVVGRILL